MENSGSLSAADVIALTRNNDGWFGSNGGTMGIFALIIIFILLFGGNGFWGNNGASQLALSDINMAQYFQTQDNALRGIAQGQATVTEQVMSSNYDNALLLKDLSNQMSNSIAGISNQIANQTNTIQNMFNQNTIRDLSDKLATTRDELTTSRQSQYLANQMTDQTNQILNSLGRYRTFPPCYDNCGCNSSLY